MTLRLLALVPLILLAGCEELSDPVQSGKRAAATAAGRERPVVTALQPGLWETTTEIAALDPQARAALEASDARALADKLGGQKQVSAVCLSADQARSPNALVIGGREQGQCSFESFSLNRGTLDAVLENAGRPELRGILEANLSPRHPSQIYEGLLEGALLFSILWLFVGVRT